MKRIMLKGNSTENYLKVYKQTTLLKNIIVMLFRLFLLISIGYVIIYPLMYMITNSIRTGQSYYDPTITWITTKTTFSNFLYAIQAMDYLNALKTPLFTKYYLQFFNLRLVRLLHTDLQDLILN